MNYKNTAVILAAGALLFLSPGASRAGEQGSTESAAEQEQGGDKENATLNEDGFSINPVLLDSEDSSGAALGLEYNLGQSWNYKLGGPTAGDGQLSGDSFRNLKVFGATASLQSNGTVASSANRNPENFLEASAKAGAFHSSRVGTFQLKFGGTYETDQEFDNKEAVYSLSFGYAKLISKKHVFALRVARGRVDPKEDEAREAALGTDSLDKFYRNEAEALAIVNIGDGPIQTLELNYQYYRESKAPAAVRAVGLSKFEMTTLRLGLRDGLYVAYSVGKLPFDQEKDRIYKIGWSYDLTKD
ncbi:MAG: hypothetical protein M3Y79_06785 [Pseudomonadota bacterium]|nr:hypothetical protein [Pseudomonadota bacterium]